MEGVSKLIFCTLIIMQEPRKTENKLSWKFFPSRDMINEKFCKECCSALQCFVLREPECFLLSNFYKNLKFSNKIKIWIIPAYRREIRYEKKVNFKQVTLGRPFSFWNRIANINLETAISY